MHEVRKESMNLVNRAFQPLPNSEFLFIEALDLVIGHQDIRHDQAKLSKLYERQIRLKVWHLFPRKRGANSFLMNSLSNLDLFLVDL